MEIADYQRRSQESDRQPTGPDALIVPLLGLAGETGTLLSSYKKWLRDGDSHRLFREKTMEDLGDVLWYLANIAEKLGVQLDEVAIANLAKTRDRFGPISKPIQESDFDAEYPAEERLPQRLTVTFEEKREGDRTVLRICQDGAQVGDFLTDNAYEEDGYRFHDAFHFAYATVLGWSPVTRHILKLKRRSNSTVNTVEDGGRARVFEESVSALVFERARHHNFYQDITEVDYDLLATIRGLVAGQEVKVRTTREWEMAILDGFRVWRTLNRERGGTVIFDRATRTMSFEPPATTSVRP